MDHPVAAYENEIWTIYVNEAEKYDKRLVEAWKEGMDSTLIFAGLFSAVVTAFIIEGYRNLKPNPQENAVFLLNQILQQLASPNSNHSFSPPPTIRTFQIPGHAIRSNVLFFLSLIFSLTGALTAIFVKQWTTKYLHATQRRPSPVRRARIRSYLHIGLKLFRLNALVDIIPTLLHIALFLFLGGLYDFFFPVYPVIGYLTIGTIGVLGLLYVATACAAAFVANCPYQIPLSALVWHFVRFLMLLMHGNNPDKRDQMVELLAMGTVDGPKWTAPGVKQRDLEGLRWTLNCLTDNAELEPFVAAIPSLLVCKEVSDPYGILQELIQDSSVALGDRLLILLRSAEHLRSDALRRQRATSCITALWSLVCADLEQPRSEKQVSIRSGFLVKSFSDFSEVLRKLLYDSDKQLASLANYTLLLLANRVLMEYSLEDNIKMQQVKPVIWALDNVRRTLPMGNVLPESYGVQPGHYSIEIAWTSVYCVRMAALNLLLVTLRSKPPLPNFIKPPERGVVRGSIAAHLIQGLTCADRYPRYQQEFVRALEGVVWELETSGYRTRLNWKMVEEVADLLGTVNDQQALNAAKQLVLRIPNSPNFSQRRVLDALGKQEHGSRHRAQ